MTILTAPPCHALGEWLPQAGSLVDAHTPPLLLAILLLFLPLFGFPISVLYALSGLVFGPIAGLAAIGVAIPFHLAGSFVLAKMVAVPIKKLLAVKNYRIPEVPRHRQAGFCFLMNVLPIPYTVKNYLMPMAGAPFRLFFWISWPIQLLMALPALLAGSSLANMDPFVLATAVVAFVAIYYAIRRVEKRYGDRWKIKSTGHGHLVH